MGEAKLNKNCITAVIDSDLAFVTHCRADPMHSSPNQIKKEVLGVGQKWSEDVCSKQVRNDNVGSQDVPELSPYDSCLSCIW